MKNIKTYQEFLNEAVLLKTGYKSDEEMSQAGIKLKNAGIQYSWSAELGNLLFNNTKDKEKAEKILSQK